MPNTSVIDFEASSSQYGTHAANTLLNSSQTFTIETWVKPESQAATHCIYSKWIPSGNHIIIIYITTNSQRVLIATALDGSTLKAFDSAESLSNGTYYHLAFVYDGTQAANGDRGIIYVNGSAVTTTVEASFPTALLNGGSLVSSIGQYNASNYFDGLMDEFRIWSDVRTPTEIADNFDRELVGDEAGLVLYHKFNENTGTTVNDESASNLDLSLQNTPAWSTDVPFIGAVTIDLSEVIIVRNAISKGTTRILSQVITLVEATVSVIRAATIAPDEILVILDTARAHITARFFSEVIVVVSNASKTPHRFLTQVLSLTDTFTKIYTANRVFTEILLIRSNVSRFLNGIFYSIWTKTAKAVTSFTKTEKPTTTYTKESKTSTTWDIEDKVL